MFIIAILGSLGLSLGIRLAEKLFGDIDVPTCSQSDSYSSYPGSGVGDIKIDNLYDHVNTINNERSYLSDDEIRSKHASWGQGDLDDAFEKADETGFVGWLLK